MSTSDPTEGYSSAWGGWVMFASVVMVTVGALDIIQGITALVKNEVYLVTESGLLVTADYTAWGWALLIWGIVMVLGGVGLFALKPWARWFAFAVAALNGILQLAWFPAYPLWSLVALALDVVVLYALTARWDEATMDLTGR